MVTLNEIVTVTMNPAIDLCTSVKQVVPVHKLRCSGLQRDPGGGGINVARVVRRLGANVTAVYTAGGSIGQLLHQLVDHEGIDSYVVPISAETREDFTIHETATGKEFRFVLAGPHVSPDEWAQCLSALESLSPFPRYLAASGSLAPGMPDDFYARVARIAKAHSAKALVDTSGSALKAALDEGVYLIKPNRRELSILVGKSLDDDKALVQACREIVDDRRASVVSLTLGDQGALLVTREGLWRAPALAVKVVSAVGAGDSFLGGLVWSLGSGHPISAAFRYGVAAGSAALISPGTELCRREDIERLYPDVVVHVL